MCHQPSVERLGAGPLAQGRESSRQGDPGTLSPARGPPPTPNGCRARRAHSTRCGDQRGGVARPARPSADVPRFRMLLPIDTPAHRLAQRLQVARLLRLVRSPHRPLSSFSRIRRRGTRNRPSAAAPKPCFIDHCMVLDTPNIGVLGVLGGSKTQERVPGLARQHLRLRAFGSGLDRQHRIVAQGRARA